VSAVPHWLSEPPMAVPRSIAMISIVVPAHDEEQVITRCLRALTEGTTADEVEVIVVCNGCSDRTAEVARRFGGPVRVIETKTPGKHNALCLGDAAATGFPRFYIDADVVVTPDSLRQMAERLDRGGLLAVSPQIQWDLDGASWAVRAFYDIDRRLPSHRETIGGSGVYGLSQTGRHRIGTFPRLTADDAYVRRCFRLHERAAVQGAVSVVTPPKTIAGVITIKTRSHFGNYELSRRFPRLNRNIGASNHATLVRLAARPRLWAGLLVYCYVKVVARLDARRQMRRGQSLTWQRDNTSRVRATP
jgi:glycosyltransferase involved in cell wall biosynthesis